ncbi:hypothetical protein SELMODRAFT_90947 [Selaginella moellendorffii]|uniref:Enoyl reductase (ER) domain-containing protein n=1 Tax=Selaginella moellendorffii TaxID=88036 RepID=D8RC19_SELML|nr:probable mannitol dehydrogenase [Selaginella moellendorffii]EFJ29773.1 hypothetical protein SELMODRAFT_90947 [Selaginella moellendorffii]|eukprot:XP_002968657.1 probable mannitol dehydrogenase [Selaginella moellendorffii]
MSKEVECGGWAAKDASGVLAPFKFPRRALRPTDVKFKITHCGICHTDLHLIHNEWGSSKYPMVPGHEVVGLVTELGPGAKKFKVGDHVGVGCMVFSCLKCDHCKHGDEQYCDKLVWTYNSEEDGKITMGGYSGFLVADEKFVVRVPDNLPLDAAAPLLCAGITVYSPMKHFGMTQAGKNFGVVGLGGLGHMAVKFGKAFGMKVTVISTSPSKEKEAREVLGAHNFIVSKDSAQMKKAAKTMDYILDTVSAPHPLDALLELLKIDGKLVMVGLPDKPLELPAGVIIFGRRSLAGSFIGSIRETQDMLDFCGKNNVTSMIELVPMDYVNKAMERLRKSDVKYRFVLDVEKTLKP